MRKSFGLWLRREFDAWLERIDPEIAWDISTHPLPDVPNQGQGRDALLTKMLGPYLSGWSDYSADLKEVVDGGPCRRGNP